MHEIISLSIAGALLVLFGAAVLAALAALTHVLCARVKKPGAEDFFRAPQTVMAVAAAVLAQELGQDAGSIRITSLKKLPGKGDAYETL